MRHVLFALTVLGSLALGAPAIGAPGGDRDGDSIPDHRDKCPDHPEDRDGFQDEDGCPDPDNDRDGIPDVRDKCPNTPENFNGYQDADGCPDRPPRKVVVVKTCPPIRVGIYFGRRSTRIPKAGRTILAEVVKVMKSNPRVRLVEVQGHADDYRDAKADKRLSLRRARAVWRYLTRKGVAKGRLVVRGYGRVRARPGARKPAQRKRNRRVTFKVLKQGKRKRPRK